MKKDSTFFGVRIAAEFKKLILEFNRKRIEKDGDWNSSKFCRESWAEYIKRHKEN